MAHIILIFILFVLIHSITVTAWFKDICKNAFGDTFMRVFYRALYNLVALVTVVIALYFIWREPDRGIWSAPTALWWLLRGIQLAGFAFGALSFEHLDGGEFMGFKQIWRYAARREVAGNIEGLTQKELVTGGVYGIVRHPIYLAGIVIFTANPDITVNGLMISVLADVYFLFGALIEERRFLRIFGDQYREYRKRVPRLIPGLHRRKG
jgi:uncharacterized membrane protein